VADQQAPAFPPPYLQPDPKEDCGYYAAAYIARCLGHPETTAEQVKAWRAETRYHETAYARRVLGAEMRTFWDVYGDEPARKVFWLGPGTEGWLRAWLADGWIAQVMLHRIPEMGHAVVVLNARDDGVLLMDPIYGHVTEPWGWFLGPGARGNGEPFDPQRCCHFIEGWYKPAAPA
jgi:hypothetical protein